MITSVKYITTVSTNESHFTKEPNRSDRMCLRAHVVELKSAPVPMLWTTLAQNILGKSLFIVKTNDSQLLDSFLNWKMNMFDQFSKINIRSRI
jgi:hypothetical protein